MSRPELLDCLIHAEFAASSVPLVSLEWAAARLSRISDFN